MEQVFDLVNQVLGRDGETRRRNLNIRGYKVIPLNSQAGLIEFVMNTTQLKSFLPSAHERCVFTVDTMVKRSTAGCVQVPTSRLQV